MGETRTIKIYDDPIQIRWDGNVWISPCNGQRHSRAKDAMRAELERYYADCGEDIQEEEIAIEINRHLSKIRSEDED